MAAGAPVIASNRSSLPEVCGEAALLVDPRSDAELAAAVELLTRDEDLRAKLTAAGVARAGEFRWSDAVQKTITVYREVMGG
jgi:glycosyltransferase involved in cell wall biosynthesis